MAAGASLLAVSIIGGIWRRRRAQVRTWQSLMAASLKPELSATACYAEAVAENPAAAGYVLLLGLALSTGCTMPGPGPVTTTWLPSHPAKLKSSWPDAGRRSAGAGGHCAGGFVVMACCSCRRAGCTSAVSGWRRELSAVGAGLLLCWRA